MKVKNIMFSGVMAAILGATGAHAAISVASQGYVDSKVGEVATSVSTLETNVANTYLTQEAAESTYLTEEQVQQEITNSLSGYATDEELAVVQETANAAATKTYVDDTFATKTALSDYALQTSLDAEKTAREAADAATTEALKGYTKTADLDKDFVSETEMATFKTENTAAIDAKVAQSDYNTKVQALEARDTELANELATKIEAPAACETQDCVLSINKASGIIAWVPLTEPVSEFLNK